jgi:tellurite resistance protein
MNAPQRQERSRALGATLPADLSNGATALKDTPSDPEAARLLALLEVCYLAASADDKLTDQEINLLVENLQSWLQAKLEPAFLVQLFEQLGTQLKQDGFQGRLKATAAILDADSRRIAYKLACVTALCDHDVAEDELKFLGGIADAFAIPATDAQAIFDALDEAITK